MGGWATGRAIAGQDPPRASLTLSRTCVWRGLLESSVGCSRMGVSASTGCSGPAAAVRRPPGKHTPVTLPRRGADGLSHSVCVSASKFEQSPRMLLLHLSVQSPPRAIIKKTVAFQPAYNKHSLVRTEGWILGSGCKERIPLGRRRSSEFKPKALKPNMVQLGAVPHPAVGRSDEEWDYSLGVPWRV